MISNSLQRNVLSFVLIVLRFFVIANFKRLFAFRAAFGMAVDPSSIAMSSSKANPDRLIESYKPVSIEYFATPFYSNFKF